GFSSLEDAEVIEAAEKHTNPPRIKLDMFLAMFSGNIFPTLQDAELYRGAGGTNPRRGPPWVATSEVPAPLTFCICSCWGTSSRSIILSKPLRSLHASGNACGVDDSSQHAIRGLGARVKVDGNQFQTPSSS
ncbi:MAG: hypothetical protein RL419_1208, partial [Actinomycetota bacterium]